MNNDFDFYFDLFLKRLPVMTVIFVLCAGLGLGMALTMPPKFQAQASLLVEGSKLPDELVVDTVQTLATEQLMIVEQRLLTRGNLIALAQKFNVFVDEPGLSPDDIVEQMREMTNIRLTFGRDQTTVMEIAFTSGNAGNSANVVNELATFVLREDAKRRKGESTQTLEFFERRVEALTDQLARQSAQIVSFKNNNKDALPEGLDYRLDRQSTLQERLNLAAREQTALREQRERIIAVGQGTATVPAAQLSPEQQQLLALERELREALVIYSDSNPKITLLRKRIENLKGSISIVSDTGEVQSSGAGTVLDIQLAGIDSRLKSLDEEIELTNAELLKLRTQIERTPEVSIELEKLERVYENTQEGYRVAVARRSAAEQGADVEAKGVGERITLIEEAAVPTSPTSPNRKLIAGSGVLLGTALATVFFALTELLNRTVRRPIDLTRGLGVQPLATIPYLEEESVKQRRRALRTILVVGTLIAIPIALWSLHTFFIPLDLLIDEIASRVGL